jgi:hypothetical protein
MTVERSVTHAHHASEEVANAYRDAMRALHYFAHMAGALPGDDVIVFFEQYQRRLFGRNLHGGPPADPR